MAQSLYDLDHKVVIAGCGPGSLDLLPLRTLRWVMEADAIVYDSLINDEILSLAKPSCVKVHMGKRSGGLHSAKQEDINNKLLDLSLQHRHVLRLKGGDPFVFGRGGEEVTFLKHHNISFEIVPAPSSSIAGPAFAGIPVTHRNVAISFAVITGHESEDKKMSQHHWDAYAGIDTLVFLMGITNRSVIASSLLKAGKPSDEPVAFVENATTAKQVVKRTTLSDLVSNPIEVEMPAIMIVGRVVDLNFTWFNPSEATSIQEIHQFLRHAPHMSLGSFE